MPMRAPPRWPPNSAQGCAAAARVRPNRNTADPPSEARRNGDADGPASERASAMPVAVPIAHHSRRAKCERRMRAHGHELDVLSMSLTGAVRALGSAPRTSYRPSGPKGGSRRGPAGSGEELARRAGPGHEPALENQHLVGGAPRQLDVVGGDELGHPA